MLSYKMMDLLLAVYFITDCIINRMQYKNDILKETPNPTICHLPFFKNSRETWAFKTKETKSNTCENTKITLAHPSTVLRR